MDDRTENGKVMSSSGDHVPGVTDDPVLRLILNGRATNLHDAEKIYLNESLDEIFSLIASPTPVPSP